MKKINILLIAGALALPVGGALVHSLPKDVKEVKAGVTRLYLFDKDMSANGATYTSGGTATTTITSSKVTLTFTNFSKINGDCERFSTPSYEYAPLWYEGDLPLEIVVNGENTLQAWGEAESAAGHGLVVKNNYTGTTFTGTGSIKFIDNAAYSPQTSVGFVSGYTKDVVINGPSVRFESGYAGAGSSYGNVLNSVGLAVRSVSGNTSTVTIKKGKLSAVSGGTKGTGNGSHSYGVYTDAGKCYLIVEGGQLETNTYRAPAGVANSRISYYSRDPDGDSLQIGPNALQVSIRNTYIGSSDKYATGEAIVGYFKTQLSGKLATDTGASKAYTKKSGKQTIDSESGKYYNAYFGEITATGSGYTGPVDGQAHSITVNVTKPASASDYKIQYKTRVQDSWEDTKPTFTNECDTTVYWRVCLAGETRIVKEGENTVKLTKENPTYTAPTAKELTYTGASQQLINVGTVTGGSFQYSLEKDGTYTATVPSATLPGTYNVYYNVIGDEYHKTLTKLGPVEVTVSNADITGAGASAEPVTYNGNEQTPAVVTTGTTVASQELTYTYSKTQDGTYGPISEISFKEPGNHKVYYKANAPYHNEVSGDFTFTINAKVLPEGANVTLNSPTAPVDYNGSDVAIDVTEAPLETTTGDEVTYVYSLSETGTYKPLADLHIKDAGEYTVYWKAVANGHSPASDSQGTFSITVNKIEGHIQTNPTAKELAYTGESQTLVNAGETTDGTIKYRLGDEGSFGDSVPSATDVGTYHVWYVLSPDNNHVTDMEPVMIEVAISENSKVVLNSAIDSGNRVYEMLAESNPEAAEALKAVLDDAKAVQTDPNVTVTAIDEATAALLEALVSSVTTLIDDIGEVKYNKDSQEAIENAREAYDLLPEEQKAEVGEEKLEVLTAAEEKYQKLKAAANSGLPGWAIFLIIFFAIVLAFVITYFLLFFVFNKWIKGSREPERVFKLSTNGQRAKLLARNFRVIERFERDIFNTKEEASK